MDVLRVVQEASLFAALATYIGLRLRRSPAASAWLQRRGFSDKLLAPLPLALFAVACGVARSLAAAAVGGGLSPLPMPPIALWTGGLGALLALLRHDRRRAGGAPLEAALHGWAVGAGPVLLVYVVAAYPGPSASVATSFALPALCGTAWLRLRSRPRAAAALQRLGLRAAHVDATGVLLLAAIVGSLAATVLVPAGIFLPAWAIAAVVAVALALGAWEVAAVRRFVDAAVRRADVQQARSLRVCIAAGAMQYWVNGFITAAIASRLPEIADRLGLDFGDLGWILGGQALALIVALWLAARLATRVGPVRVAALGTFAFAVSALLPGQATNPVELAAILLVVAIANGPLDAAVPAMASDLEHRSGRPRMSLMEFWFVGGGLCGGGAAWMAVGRLEVGHFLSIAAAIAATVALLAALMLATAWRSLPGAEPDPESAQTSQRRGWTALLAIATVAFAALWSEGALIDWSTFLFRERGADGGWYVAGYVCFTAGLGVGLLAGRRLIDLLGPVLVARVGGVVFAAGVLVALISPSLVVGSIGLALAGIGLGNVHPIAMSAAGGVKPRVRSIAVVNSLSYCGLVASKPIIGFAADTFSLEIALGLLVAFGIWMSLFAGALRCAQGGERSGTTRANGR